jgi:hypothetical protein
MVFSLWAIIYHPLIYLSSPDMRCSKLANFNQTCPSLLNLPIDSGMSTVILLLGEQWFHFVDHPQLEAQLPKGDRKVIER